jgi:uncharacterized repeat protein (TIGR01451 family)
VTWFAGLALVAAGAVAPVLIVPATQVQASAAAPAARPPVRNTGLAISPVFSQTLVGGFTQAGNTLLQCDRQTGGAALPAGGCVHDINTALTLPTSTPCPAAGCTYNNQVIMQNLDRDNNPATATSSSATVNVPADAKVVFAELQWMGTSQASPNPNIVWNPNIYTEPMKLSVDDASHYVTVNPDRGTSIRPGFPAQDTNDYYYTAAADITSLVSGRSGQIQMWGADAPFPANGLNQASLAWDVVVVYEYPGVDLAAGHVGKQITVQEGFVYQISSGSPTNTVVNVPAVTNPDDVQIGLIAGEGDAGLTGDRFEVNGQNITHPVTGQTNNFFVSYAQGATNPNWTGNFSTDDVVFKLPSGIVHAGDTSVTLTTVTSGDGYFLRGLTTAIPVPSIGLDKHVAPRYTHVGQVLTYTFTVTNTSGVPIQNLFVVDPTLGGRLPDCEHPGVLAPGTSYQCTATHVVTRQDIANGRIDNTATAHGTGLAGEQLQDTATATTTTSTLLEIDKDGSPKPVEAGAPFTYTITVRNVGDSDAADVTVTDPLPAGLVNPSVTATPGVTAAISNGVLTATAPLLSRPPTGDTFTLTVRGTIAKPFSGTVLRNTATVQAPNTNCPDENSTDPLCSSTDETEVLQPGIVIRKVVSDRTPKPGETFRYHVLVFNRSSVATATATISDPIPPPLTGSTWTCRTTTPQSTCGTTAGTGDIVDVPLSLAPRGLAMFTITVTVPLDFQGGRIINTATATPTGPTICAEHPAADSCSAEVPIVVTPEPARLLITKNHSPVSPTPTPGQALTYTVTVTNPSPSTIAHGTFDDPVPTGIDADPATTSWDTATTGVGTTVTPSSGTGFPTGQTIALVVAPGGTVTFTINTHVAADFTGSNIDNIASVTPGTNTECADGQPTCDADDSFTIPARLAIEKTHSPIDPPPTPGEQVTYRVRITNPGNGIGQGTFTDQLPPQLEESTATWTCAAVGAGSSCGTPSGNGSPTDVPIAVESGGSVTFTITATILPSTTAVTVRNVGRVTPGTNTGCEDGRETCDSEDEFTSTPEPATLLITKSHAPSSPMQGQTVTYTITVTNTSETTQAQGAVTDNPFDPALENVSWTAVAGAGSTVSPDNGTGAITGVAVRLAPGGIVTFTVHATIRSNWPGGDIRNTAYVAPGENTDCDPDVPSCSAETVFPTPALITITKVHSPTNPAAKPGERVVYQVVVRNLSFLQQANATFDDPLPPELERATAQWSTVLDGVGTSATPPSGTGPPAGVVLTLAPEGRVTFLITATVKPSFPGGTITNTSTATAGENTACDLAPTCDASTSFTSVPEPARLAIAKTYRPHRPVLHRGQQVTYLVTVTNLSTTTGSGTVSDPTPSGIVDKSWTASATSGSTVTPASGTGAVTGVRVVVAPQGRVTFTITARVDPDFAGDFDIANLARLALGPNTRCAPTNAGEACEAAAVFHVPVPAAEQPASTVPLPPLASTGEGILQNMQAALLFLMAGAGLVYVGRRRRTAGGRHR